MLNEKYFRENPKSVKVFVGLPAEEFWEIVEEAKELLEEYDRRRLDRPNRKRGVGGGRKCELSLVARLGMVLTYLRLDISQEAVAMLYGATQSDVSRQLRQMLPLLAEVLPTPDVWEKLETETPLTKEEVIELTELSDGQVIVDATEQRVNRPQDSRTRKVYYSGKKKQFTLVTQMVTDGEHHIGAISVCFPGAMVDKSVSDDVGTTRRLPDGCHGMADKGYQGIDKQVGTQYITNPETSETEGIPRFVFTTPFKKPRGGELTEQQLDFNQRLNSARIRVEHCIGWAKNWSILSGRFRAHHSLYTLIMQVICGLVNLQTSRWQALSA